MELIQKYPGTNSAYQAKDILDSHPAFKQKVEKQDDEKKEKK